MDDANGRFFTLSSAVVFAAVPGVAFTVVALFQAGFLTYFGLPLNLITLDAQQIFIVLAEMFRVGVSTNEGRAIFISLAIISWPSMRLDAALIRRAGLIASVSVLSFMLTATVRASYVLPLVAACYIGCVISCLQDTVGPGRTQHVGALQVNVFRLLIIGLLAAPAAFFGGFRFANGGVNGYPPRYLAATAHASCTSSAATSCAPTFYLLVSVRPDETVGVRIDPTPAPAVSAPSDEKTRPRETRFWRVLTPVTFRLFDQPLAGVLRCPSSSAVGERKKTFFPDVWYRPQGVYTAVDLHCTPDIVPITVETSLAS